MSTINDSFGGFTQQAGDGPEKKAEGTLPVFIKQILLQQDDVFKLFGFEYKMVSTVAVVRNIDHSSTKITYSLEDRTGKINGHLWIEEGEAPRGAGIMLNTYVRVVGAVRQQGDAKSLLIYKIHPVKGINEVNTHMIEVVNARFQAEEYCKGGQMPGGNANGHVKMETTYGFGDSTASSTQGIEGKSLVIYKALQASTAINPELGVSKQELYQKFPHISPHEIDNIITRLSDDGQIYSSIDVNHFVSCHH